MRKILMTTAAMLIGVSAIAQAESTMPYPDASQTKPMLSKSMKQGEPAQNIAQVTMSDDNFDTLATAVKSADLTNTLKSADPITVFAPTDAAFNALPDGTIESLVKPENKTQLQGVLKKHIVKGDIKAKDIKMGKTLLDTLQGDKILVEKSASGVTVNGARVVMADVNASNGTIHAISKVIMPN